MKKIRILYTLQSGRMGGAEHSLYYLLRTLDLERFEPEVLFLESGGLLEEKLLKLGISSQVLGLNLSFKKTRWGRISNPLALVQVGLLLRKSARSLREHLAKRPAPFDLVHTNSWLVNNIVLMAKLSEPVIWNVRDLNRPRLTKALVNQAAKVVCVSKAVQDLLYQPQCAKKFAIVHNGIECDVFQPDVTLRKQARVMMGLSDEKLGIGLFGRLTPLKGQAFFLEAAASFLKRNPDIHVVLVGKSLFGSQDHQTYLENLVLESGISSQVLFMGYREDISTLLNGLDVYVHPTTTRDAFPRATLEAMACAVPTLAARLGGIVEQIRHGEDGFLFTPNDKDGLLGLLEKLVEEPELRKRLGQNGRKSVLARFPLAAKTREMENIYLEVISQ